MRLEKPGSLTTGGNQRRRKYEDSFGDWGFNRDWESGGTSSFVLVLKY